MDSTTLTHVAAIAVGVLVTVVAMKSFVLPSTTTTGTTTKTDNKDSNGGSKKKKKNKTKNKKGNVAETTKQQQQQQQQQKSSKARSTTKATTNDNDDDDDDMDTNDKENTSGNAAAAAGGGSKKKKNNNKKKNANNNTNNSSIRNAKEVKFVIPDAPSTGANTGAAGAAGATWQKTPPSLEEEEDDEWESVSTKNKKKRNKPAATVKSASIPTAAAAAAAAGAEATPVTADASTATAVAATTTTDSVTVDAKKIGIIIGPKGATMMVIQEATGCKLDINAPNNNDSGPNANANANTGANRATKAGVVITGPDKDAIAKAKKAVLELASKGYATLLQGENFGEYGTEVHPRHLNEIVGPKGRVIQAIQSQLGVKITIPSTEWNPGMKNHEKVKPAFVGIAGTRDNAQKAKQIIQQLVRYHHHELTHPGMIHEEIYVPQEFFHCVIGPRGSEIKHIRGNYKVDVYMPNADSYVKDNVLVVGKQTNVDKAITYIQLLMDRDAEQKDQKYSDEYY